MSTPASATRPVPLQRAGSEAGPARQPSGDAGPATSHTTVVVASQGFHYQGRYYRERDELDVPAEQLSRWLDGGHVRLPREQRHDARTIVAAFDRGQPIKPDVSTR